MIGDGLQIIGIVVHVVSVAGLSRATMSAPISRNDAIAFAEEKKHLRVPIIGRQRPTVAKDDRLTFAPVFIIYFDVSSVFFTDSDVWHNDFLSVEIARESAARGRIALTNFVPPRRVSMLRLCDFSNLALCYPALGK
jgi:hypothetical protein